MDKAAVIKYIDDNAAKFTAISDQIWDYAELSLKEVKSAELYVKALEQEGFIVQSGVSGMPTAFIGKYGSGHPVIGILAEFDALGSLSQVADAAQREKQPGMENGHGCGHNLLGAGSFGAAVAVKQYLKDQGKGTVMFFGCPGEEGGAGKAFMAKDKLFYDLDMAITWHPGNTFSVVSGTNNSSIQIEYEFTGIAAHAAGDPHLGRSALDAVELMNVGVQFLREHMPSYARVHYAITDAGGISPNVVPYKAKVLYMIRCGRTKETLELVKRVDKIAAGAAMMTETAMSRQFIDGTSDVVSNEALEKLLYQSYQTVGVPSYTPAELAYAKQIQATFTEDPLPGLIKQYGITDQDLIAKLKDHSVLADLLIPYAHSDHMSMGSTDVGDVSYQTPTAQIGAVAWPLGNPGHSWQNVAMGKSSIAHKGVITAAKVLALTAIAVYEDPTLLNPMKEEFKQKTADGYFSPIEDGAKPTAI